MAEAALTTTLKPSWVEIHVSLEDALEHLRLKIERKNEVRTPPTGPELVRLKELRGEIENLERRYSKKIGE